MLVDKNNNELWRRTVLKTVFSASILPQAYTSAVDATKNSNYKLIQNDREIIINPIEHNNNPVEDFYNYNNGSSNSLTNIEKSDTSRIFLYNGPNGISLCIVHDKSETGKDGEAEYEFDGLPQNGSWAVKDDPSDKYSLNKASWAWKEGQTGGGVFRNLLGNDVLTIESKKNTTSSIEILSGDADSPSIIKINSDTEFSIQEGVDNGSRMKPSVSSTSPISPFDDRSNPSPKQNADVRTGAADFSRTEDGIVEISQSRDKLVNNPDYRGGVGLTTHGPLREIDDENTLRIKFRTDNNPKLGRIFPFGIVFYDEKKQREISISCTNYSSSPNEVTLSILTDRDGYAVRNTKSVNYNIFDGDTHTFEFSIFSSEDDNGNPIGNATLKIDNPRFTSKSDANEIIELKRGPNEDWSFTQTRQWGIGVTGTGNPNTDSPDIIIKEVNWSNGRGGNVFGIKSTGDGLRFNPEIRFPIIMDSNYFTQNKRWMTIDNGNQFLFNIRDQITDLIDETIRLTEVSSPGSATIGIRSKFTDFTDNLISELDNTRRIEAKMQKRKAIEETLERVRCERQLQKITMANISSLKVTRYGNNIRRHSGTLEGIQYIKRQGDEQDVKPANDAAFSFWKLYVSLIVLRGKGKIATGRVGNAGKAISVFEFVVTVFELAGTVGEPEYSFSSSVRRDVDPADVPDPNNFDDEKQWKRVYDKFILKSCQPVEQQFNEYAISEMNSSLAYNNNPRRYDSTDLLEEFETVSSRDEIPGELGNSRRAMDQAIRDVENKINGLNKPSDYIPELNKRLEAVVFEVLSSTDSQKILRNVAVLEGALILKGSAVDAADLITFLERLDEILDEYSVGAKKIARGKE